MRARRATTAINEVELDVKNVPFRFVDVGGQRTQRQKWHQCFTDVTAIMFLASASEYDEFLREDHSTNRLEESLKVFETLINYKYFQDVEFILFLNKHDLLKEKIHRVNIRTYCKDFVGNPTSIGDVEKYLVNKFSSLRKGALGSEDAANKSTVNGSKPSPANNTTSNKSLTKLHASNNKIRNSSQFDEIAKRPFSSSSVFSEVNHLLNSDNERFIYSHFTTAIDTNNIKTIFEMVRLMIFEKNCKAIMLN